MIDDNYKEAGVLKCTCEKEIGRVVKIQGQFVPTLKVGRRFYRSEGQFETRSSSDRLSSFIMMFRLIVIA